MKSLLKLPMAAGTGGIPTLRGNGSANRYRHTITSYEFLKRRPEERYDKRRLAIEKCAKISNI